MYIETVPNRGSPPAILLRESYRDGKRVCKRTLLNLSHWPPEQVEGLRGVLKGGVVLPPGEQPSPSSARCRTGPSLRFWARRAPLVWTGCSGRGTGASPTARATSSWP